MARISWITSPALVPPSVHVSRAAPCLCRAAVAAVISPSPLFSVSRLPFLRHCNKYPTLFTSVGEKVCGGGDSPNNIRPKGNTFVLSSCVKISRASLKNDGSWRKSHYGSLMRQLPQTRGLLETAMEVHWIASFGFVQRASNGKNPKKLRFGLGEIPSKR